jgi:hypothetical protein
MWLDRRRPPDDSLVRQCAPNVDRARRPDHGGRGRGLKNSEKESVFLVGRLDQESNKESVFLLGPLDQKLNKESVFLVGPLDQKSNKESVFLVGRLDQKLNKESVFLVHRLARARYAACAFLIPDERRNDGRTPPVSPPLKSIHTGRNSIAWYTVQVSRACPSRDCVGLYTRCVQLPHARRPSSHARSVYWSSGRPNSQAHLGSRYTGWFASRCTA